MTTILSPIPYRNTENEEFTGETTIRIETSKFEGIDYQEGKLSIIYENCRFNTLHIENQEEIEFKDISVSFLNCYIGDLKIEKITSTNISLHLSSSIISGNINNQNISYVGINNCIINNNIFLQNINTVDNYSFNGQRLILKSGEYGKDGAEYVTEKYSNIKIKSIGSVTGQIWKGPEYWEVTFEDGSQGWYGGTTSGLSNARTPIEYNIVKWKDSKGNYITYNYLQTGLSNIATISSIQWGGNETLGKPHFNKIDFTYSNRSLAEDSYVGGARFLQTQLLSEIKVSSNGSQFKKYTIDYLQNGTNYQAVDKITEYNADNNAANPVAFTYPVPTQPNLEFSNNNVESFENVKLSGDFNGDSYLDFVMNNGTVKLGGLNDTDISTGKTFNAEAKVINTLLDEEGQIHNGNGIVQYEGGKVVGYIFRNNTFVKVFEKLVYDESTCLTGNDPPPAGCHILQPSLNEGDINGDGISDVFLTLKQELCQWVPDPNCNNVRHC